MTDKIEKLKVVSSEPITKTPVTPEYLEEPPMSLAKIGDKLGETHATAVDVRAELLTIKVEADVYVKKAINDLATALDNFNKSMDATIEKLNKLIGTE